MWRFPWKGRWANRVDAKVFGSDDRDHTRRSLPHPKYWDGGREGVMAFAAVCLASLIVFTTNDVPWISRYWKIVLTLLVAGGVSFWVGGLSRRARARKRAERAVANRAARNAEAEKKIAEMQRKNSRIPKVPR